MPAAAPHILLVENDLPLTQTYEEYLKGDRTTVHKVETGAEALRALASGTFAAAISMSSSRT